MQFVLFAQLPPHLRRGGALQYPPPAPSRAQTTVKAVPSLVREGE